jgi:hypothetical protein
MIMAVVPVTPADAASDLAGRPLHTVQASRLRQGSRLKFPIYDGRDVLLLADGQVVTEAFLERLRQRGVLSVKVHQSELPRICAGEPQGTAASILDGHGGAVCRLKNEATERLDAEMLRGQLGLPPQGEAFAGQLTVRGATLYDEDVKDQFVERQSWAAAKIEGVFQGLAAGNGLDLGALGAVTDEALSDMMQDADLFACLGVNPFANGYPARHSLHVCMLALAIGTQLKLDRQTLKELAIGCLIHDAGMLKIPAGAYQVDRKLTRVEFLEITKHPVIVFDMMKDMRAVPYRSAFIAYQMHERCNGSGYPRRREGGQIHFLSKVAAVADHYVGLVSPRLHRPGLLPYYAVETMLKSVAAKLFDPAAVRALLQTVSLFPLGSYVQLSDGRVGRVIRTNGEAYASPILEVWHPDNLQSVPEVVDLLTADVRIMGPLASLEAAGRPLCLVSPESLALQTQALAISDPASQRRHQRVAVCNAIQVFGCEGDSGEGAAFLTEGISSDVSSGGLAFTCGWKLNADRIIVELKPGQEDGPCFLCRIVRTTRQAGGDWEYGAAFVKRVPKPALMPAVARSDSGDDHWV